MESTQADIAIEDDTMEIIGFEIFVNQNTLPVLSPADIVLQYLNLSLC